MTNKTTASQPKSIGDDAQFRILAREWFENAPNASGAKAWTEFCAYIDNFRAPAAQASATIQAAPNKDAIRKVFMDHGFTVKAGETDLKQYVFDAANALLALAATIQEPVMVAEPVGKALYEAERPKLLVPKNWPWESLPEASQAEFNRRAAPMVADPAGVAWTGEQVLDLLLKEYISSAAGRTLRNGDMVMFNLSNLTDFINIAATVKAVPSEALDTKLLDALGNESWNLECFDMPTGGDDADIGWRVVGHHMAEPTRRIVAEVYEDNPRAAIKAALAAPLADKTDDATTKPGA